MSGLLGISLDIAVLVCLGFTIFYVIKLTKSLNNFRDLRNEFHAIMRELTKNIDTAQRSVENLKRACEDWGGSLQKTINESRKMAGDLEMINKVSENLAERLESGRLPATIREESVFFTSETEDEDEKDFAIFDREYSGSEPDAESEPDARQETPPAGFASKAEQDLYEALQRTRKLTGRGMA